MLASLCSLESITPFELITPTSFPSCPTVAKKIAQLQNTQYEYRSTLRTTFGNSWNTSCDPRVAPCRGYHFQTGTSRRAGLTIQRSLSEPARLLLPWRRGPEVQRGGAALSPHAILTEVPLPQPLFLTVMVLHSCSYVITLCNISGRHNPRLYHKVQ
jgi:hypothetical protein